MKYAVVALWPFLVISFLIRIGHGPDMLDLLKRIFTAELGVRLDGTTYLLPPKEKK